MAKIQSFTLRTSSLKDLLGTPLHRNTALLMIVALSIIGVWVNLIGHSPLFLVPRIDTSYYGLSRNIYLSGRILVVLCLFFFCRFFEKHATRICVSTYVMLCIVTSLHGFNAHQTILDAVLVELVSQFLMGVSYPLIVCILYATIANRLRIETAIIVIGGAQILEQLLSSGLNALLTSGTLTVLCIVLPPISCIAFLGAQSKSGNLQHEKIVGAAAKYSIGLVLGAFLALALASTVSSVGFWSSVRVDYFAEDTLWSFVETLIACALLLALSYFTIYRRAGDPLSVRYQLPFLVVIAAFFCASVQSLFSIEIPGLDSFVLSVEFFAHVFAWVAMVSAMQKLELPALRLAGMAQLFHATIGFLWELLSTSSSPYPNVALSVMCYALIMITALSAPIINGFYFRRKKPTIEDDKRVLIDGELPFSQGVSGSDIVDDLKSRSCDLGKYYGLTTREIDVLTLIVQGRSQSRIEEELTLSKSTVKTHTSNIFSKMKVHSRQEVIDLAFGKTESETLP